MTGWTAPCLWPDATAWIVAGGPSVAGLDLDRLRGRKVIAINSSWERVPWAPVLFFADARWWRLHSAALWDYRGLIVSTCPSVRHERIHSMKGLNERGISANRSTLCIGHTSTQAALNLAAHFGVSRINLLGVDLAYAPDGRCHHHAPHPWEHSERLFKDQRLDIASTADPLLARGIKVRNLSPVSDLPWPHMTFEEALSE